MIIMAGLTLDEHIESAMYHIVCAQDQVRELSKTFTNLESKIEEY